MPNLCVCYFLFLFRTHCRFEPEFEVRRQIKDTFQRSEKSRYSQLQWGKSREPQYWMFLEVRLIPIGLQLIHSKAINSSWMPPFPKWIWYPRVLSNLLILWAGNNNLFCKTPKALSVRGNFRISGQKLIAAGESKLFSWLLTVSFWSRNYFFYR